MNGFCNINLAIITFRPIQNLLDPVRTLSPAGQKQALADVNPAGTIVHLGFLPEATFSPKLLTLKGARMVGSIGGSGMFETVVPRVATAC